jgi:hypothetical protein
MNGPKEFGADLSRLQEVVATKSRQLVQGTARVLADEAISGGNYSVGTPIRTGFHRSHWDASVDGPPEGPPAADQAGAEARVEAAIETFTPGSTLYLTNNGPAIRRLEFDGWSPQAPDGFVRPAAEAIQLIVDEVATAVMGDS